jgi:hypothetical protein
MPTSGKKNLTKKKWRKSGLIYENRTLQLDKEKVAKRWTDLREPYLATCNRVFTGTAGYPRVTVFPNPFIIKKYCT